MSESGVWQEQLSQSVWLIEVRGRLDQGLSPQLEDRLVDLLEQGRNQIVVSLTDVTYINSGGLRCLVSAWRNAQKQNGDVILYGLNPRLSEIFSMIGFDSVFTIVGSRKAAHAAFDEPSSN